MKVFLIGASGVMGRPTTTALLAAGHEVVGLARTSTAGAVVTALGAEVAPGSVFDRESLVRGMRGCDVVVNLATCMPVGTAMARPGAWRANDRLRSEGSARVVAAAREVGIGRVVQQSRSVVYADAGDEWIDELAPIDLTQATEPLVVAESHVEALTRAGGEGVVLRFGQVAGPEPTTRWFLRRARSGRPTGLGDPDSWIHLIHVDDVGSAAVAALTAPAGSYNVGAEPATRRDLADQHAVAGGRGAGRFHSDLVRRLGGQRLEMSTRSQRVSSQRFSDRTGWHPQFPKLTPDWFDGVI